jgi:methylamine---corrinoid protein Co-methyltransferase
MMNFLDICERAIKGPIMSEKDFDMKVFMPKLSELVRKYGIKYDKDNPVPCDDKVADSLFQAAVEFLAAVGIYCQDTNRLIQFTKEEILSGIAKAPGKCFFGEGKDARVFGMRKPDDKKVPWLHVGSGIVSTTEEMITNKIEAYASIPEVDSISIPALDSIRGIPVAAGSPVELYAAIRSVKIGRDALIRAGRPGLPIANLVSTAASAVTTIAASTPQFGLRPTDGWLCGTVAENKLEYGTMNKIAYLLNWGGNVGAETAPILGGYCGGPAGTAIASTAYMMIGLLALKGNYQLHFPVHFKYGCSTTRDVLWVVSVSCQAASRNIPMPVIWLGYMAGGPNTKMYFYESAAWLLAATTSGAPSVQTPHSAKAVKIDGFTPMECQFGVDMAKAAAKYDRKQANGLVKKLLERYEPQIDKAPSGDRYQDCYHVTTGKPSEGYVRLVNEVKEELSGMGISFA